MIGLQTTLILLPTMGTSLNLLATLGTSLSLLSTLAASPTLLPGPALCSCRSCLIFILIAFGLGVGLEHLYLLVVYKTG